MTDLSVYAGNSVAEVQAFEQWVGRPVDRISAFLDRMSWTAFDNSIAYNVGVWSKIDRPVTWSVPLVAVGANLADAAAGAYDSHYLKAAQAMAALRPNDSVIYVRPGWEFNGGWFPWTAQGHEQDYIDAFKDLVTVFRSVDSRFRFDWSPNIGDQGLDPSKAYPGDDYVDVVGMVFYKGTTGGPTDALGAWDHVVNQNYGLQWQADFAAAHQKPTSFTEWGVNSDDSGPYIQQLAQWTQTHNVAYQALWNTNASYPSELSSGQYSSAGEAFRSAFGTDPHAITGVAGQAETLTGVSGAPNLLIGAAGESDTLVGGNGDDGFIVMDPKIVVIEPFNTGGSYVESYLSTYTLPDNVSNLTIRNSNGAFGQGNTLNNRLMGGLGNDTLDGAGGSDTLQGGGGDNQFVFHPGTGHENSVITDFVLGSGAHHDTVNLQDFGYSSFYQIQASITQNFKGSLLVTPSGDTVFFNDVQASSFTADNFMFGGDLPTRPVWNPYMPTLLGDLTTNYIAGKGTLVGTTGDDFIAGQGGPATMSGGKGNDTYTVDSLQQVVIEAPGQGVDRVNSYTPSYTLAPNVENLVVYLNGALGVGNSSSNNVIANGSFDTIDGGAGNDALTGGGGNTTFLFRAGSDHDIITNFKTGTANHDIVNLNNYGFTSWSQIQAALLQQDAGVVLKMPSHQDTILFQGLHIADLSSEDFQFAGAAAPIYSVASSGDVAEGGALQFTITRNNDITQYETVSYQLSGSGQPGVDFDAPSGSITFKDYQTSTVITLQTHSDNIVQGNRNVTLSLTAASGPGVVDAQAAAITAHGAIIDTTPAPIYAISGSPSVNEGSDLAFTFSRTSDTGAQTVNYTVGGTATSDADFTSPSGSMSFAAGEVSKQVVIHTLADLQSEGTEKIVLNLSGFTGAGTLDSAHSNATGSILDVAPLSTTVHQLLPGGYAVITTSSNQVTTDTFDFADHLLGKKIATTYPVAGGTQEIDRFYDASYHLLSSDHVTVTQDSTGTKTLLQHFDAQDQQTGVDLTQINADGTNRVAQTFDGQWNRTSAEMATTYQVTNGTQVIDRHYDAAYQVTITNVTTHTVDTYGDRTMVQHYDANYHQTGVMVTTLSPDGNKQTVDTYLGDFTPTGHSVDQFNVTGQTYHSTHATYDETFAHLLSFTAYAGTHLDGAILG